MEYDYSKLNGKIIETFDTQANFAKAMDWSENTVSKKLNNLVPWKQTDIDRAVEILELSTDEIQQYFFNKKVQLD